LIIQWSYLYILFIIFKWYFDLKVRLIFYTVLRITFHEDNKYVLSWVIFKLYVYVNTKNEGNSVLCGLGEDEDNDEYSEHQFKWIIIKEHFAYLR